MTTTKTAENPLDSPLFKVAKHMVTLHEITWKGDDGCVYRKYVTLKGRVIHVEMLDKWPYAEIGDALDIGVLT